MKRCNANLHVRKSRGWFNPQSMNWLRRMCCECLSQSQIKISQVKLILSSQLKIHKQVIKGNLTIAYFYIGFGEVLC